MSPTPHHRPQEPWRGRELFEREGWRREIGPAELEALETLREHTSAGVDAESLGPAEARLPDLADTVRDLSHELEHGTGAVLLRRLPVETWTVPQAERAFWALALQLGTPVSQSPDGKRLFPVRDAGYAPGDPRFRGPMSSKRLSFHTDRCDVIAFLCLQPALEGGETYVVSSVALRDELAQRDPAALEILRQPFPYLRHTVDHGNALPYVELPVFSARDGRFAAHFLRVLIERADASPDAPNLTGAQRSALDALEELAGDPAFHVSFNLEAGDVLLLNNWTTFHRRSEFIDAPELERKRHLLRIWLSMPNSRPIDARFAEHFGATEAGALRGGMRPIEA